MKAVKVQCTVNESYAETNHKNINTVMADLQALKNPGIKYSALFLDDGKSFVHFAMCLDEDTAAIVNNLESFQYFRQQLKESQPEIPPVAEDMTLVAAAYEVFG